MHRVVAEQYYLDKAINNLVDFKTGNVEVCSECKWDDDYGYCATCYFDGIELEEEVRFYTPVS